MQHQRISLFPWGSCTKYCQDIPGSAALNTGFAITVGIWIILLLVASPSSWHPKLGGPSPCTGEKATPEEPRPQCPQGQEPGPAQGWAAALEAWRSSGVQPGLHGCETSPSCTISLEKPRPNPWLLVKVKIPRADKNLRSSPSPRGFAPSSAPS